ncbi:class I SAM-dependent methyltransferase [Metallosphaera tengchongensis]|uniref:Class I SAM-dependent methyltransferase n=1 Tax=Metallosphaera tengchongensis TaxID=1532350 RepID=A0A6N0NZ05_9CREN|nr:class I SAM-dependent methyltransferase [Metallosphaera tengchongensis]QKR00381.1 class I SAM-dependent methyltransferase [Metallosphaera tengchongensis]
MSAAGEEATLKVFESDFYISEMTKVWDEGQKWSEWVKELIKRFNLGRSVLDVPCGVGRVSYFLSKEGFNVLGVDISDRMISLARKNVPDVSFLKGDMRKLGDIVGGQKFDVVLNLFNSLGYYSEEEDLQILSSLRQVTKGVAVINLDNRDYVLFNLPDVKYAYIPPYMVIDNSRFDPMTSRVQVIRKYVDGKGNEVGSIEYSQRFYSLHEMVNMVKKAGFEVLGVFSGYSWKNFEIVDPEMTLILSPST